MTEDDHTLVTSLFGYLMLSRGIGNILSTPISTSLQGVSGGGSNNGSHHLGFDVDGGRYEKMIVFTGTCFAGTAIICAVGWIAGATDGFVMRRRRGGISA
jgi:MFS transporter, MCT family, solute carrier family 16 (monocarboxylic acid transporters), member 10